VVQTVTRICYCECSKWLAAYTNVNTNFYPFGEELWLLFPIKWRDVTTCISAVAYVRILTRPSATVQNVLPAYLT
jgi:hypothetical protein